jgi:hypothetical protein
VSELLTLKDQTDDKGRLLLEDSAPRRAQKQAAREGVSMRAVACDFKDSPSRLGGLMNSGAYEALRHDTAEVLSGFAWLAGNYLELHPTHKGTVPCLFDVSNMAITLPLVLFRRAQDPVPPHGALPSWVGWLFKASRGVFSNTVDLLAKQGPVATTAAAVVRFAEDEGNFVRAETRRVCAAPLRLIERTIGVILTGEGADPTHSRLGELVRFETLWEFYVAQEAFNEAVSNYRNLMERVMGGQPVRDPEELFRRTVVEDGRRWTFGEMTASLLEHLNAVQDRLNLLLERSPDAPALRFEDILRIL